MAAIDLLEELKLHAYYPQQLSFSESIKLRRETQNGCPKKYGLEIVRKLLMFDSTAVVSVTTEINERLNSAVQRERKLNPMDLLVVVMNCCDDFLRQLLVEKMVVNKLSIPILLPSVKNGSRTLLLLALRSLVPEIQDRTRESSATLTDTLVDIKNPFVSFIRVGDLHRSKSKLVNELLNPNSFSTFFHRECPSGSAKRSVSNGSIEAAWFQSLTATEEEFNCRFFTALNLRGDARDYPKQTQFLCEASTLVVFMVDSFKPFKKLYENVLKDVDVSQTNIIVSYISAESPDKVDEEYFEFLEDLETRGVISEVKYDWNEGEKMSDHEFTNDLRQTISKYFKPEHRHSNQMSSYANFIKSGKNLGFSLDEDKLEYKSGKSSADKFIGLVLKLSSDCKPLILPLQGEPWEKIGKLEREQPRKSEEKNQDEHFFATKETEKRRQREIQCRYLIQQNEAIQAFFFKFHLLQEQNLLYYLNYCKIKLDARGRVITSVLLEEYKKAKKKQSEKLRNEGITRVMLHEMELKIENSTIGLEHMLRECGQMFEAVISEEIRMKEELTKAPLTPVAIRNFPTIVARLLMMGQPLELMDGETSNVPITWMKTVFNQIKIMTSNAKVFILSIIGVQSSGKSTLLNALFGLQSPSSSGRCTRGIYCHLIPIEKESLHTEYDYILIVDTEGLGSSEFSGKSTFRDIELATFAIGLADATIINMKGENWAEIKDILQIVAHGLIRIRKAKAKLELMPRCMFVLQNVPAADEEKIRLGQEKQLMLLDEAIKTAGSKEGFTEITKVDDVVKYDPVLHSWYFPDLWSGRPPKARISQDYIGKTNELRQNLMQVMKKNPSKLTISGFFLRMSYMWNAMLHNDFVLCFRSTWEIMSGMVLNDRFSHELDSLKGLNKLEQTKIRESICSFRSVEEFRAEKERIFREVRDAVEKNCTNMKATLQDVINATDICASLKQKYEISLKALKVEELRRIEDETAKVMGVQMTKIQFDSDQRVKDLKAKIADLEMYTEEVVNDKLNEAEIKEFEELWQQLINDSKLLVDERMKIVESEIKETICRSIKRFYRKDKVHLEIGDLAELLRTHLNLAMPEVTKNDTVQNSQLYIFKANSRFHVAVKNWELQFQNQKDLEFCASYLERVMFEVGQLLEILTEEYSEVRPEADETRSGLPPGYSFTRDYITRFIKFACNYTYNRSLENSKRFIAITDPLADICERYIRSVSHYRQMSAEANIEAASKQIFDYAKRSFVVDLGELIKAEVCKEDNKNPTFKSKRTFLRTILTDLGQRTNNVAQVNEEKQRIFKEFMIYVELAASEASENFFLVVKLKLLKEMLTKENAPETDFQKMVENNVGKVVEKAKNALRHAETKCIGRAREYVRIFKDYMNVTSEIDFRINIPDGFTKAVLDKINTLYADFLSKVNSSFETLVCEDNRAAIRPLFEKIMGCREKCPFCSAPCSQSLEKHVGDHRAYHYPTGVRGTVDIWGLLANPQETCNTAEDRRRKPKNLSLDTCQTLVGPHVDISTKYNKWYHQLFNWNYHSFKNFKEFAECENWDIPYSQDYKTSLFWKWFMAQFDRELAEHYNALCPVIPEAWISITWEEAKESLDEPDMNS